MEAKGIIRKIAIGDIKEGITYKVGQYMMGGRLFIEGIEKDLNTLATYGINKYDIFVSERDSHLIRLWKSVENMNVVVEYDISVEGGES